VKQQTQTVHSDEEFRAAKDLLDQLIAKKETVDNELNATWDQLRDFSSPAHTTLSVGVIERAMQCEPGVTPHASAELEELKRRPSILQSQSYMLKLAIDAQREKTETAQTRASFRLLGSEAGDAYRKRAAQVLAATDALIAANAEAYAELRSLGQQGLIGLPEAQCPRDRLQLVQWRHELAQIVEGMNRLAKAE
jgi:hypothetical protein